MESSERTVFGPPGAFRRLHALYSLTLTQKPPQMLTVLLLTISNIFMTFAWYGHLKFKESPLAIAILVSWLIAFAEYCFQVPANRWGSAQFSPVQLKVMQEIITLVVFSVFAVFYLDTKLQWNHLIAFLLIVGAVFLVRKDAPVAPSSDPQEQVAANDSTN